jgi:hypothetical protein
MQRTSPSLVAASSPIFQVALKQMIPLKLPIAFATTSGPHVTQITLVRSPGKLKIAFVEEEV